MKRCMLLLLFAISFDVSAADKSRCGTDSFGNIVCMDKDGVLFNVSREYLNEEAVSGASGVTDAERKRREELREKVRCGTDSFGNKVCR